MKILTDPVENKLLWNKNLKTLYLRFIYHSINEIKLWILFFVLNNFAIPGADGKLFGPVMAKTWPVPIKDGKKFRN